jgi:thioredoxin reductase
MTVKQTDCEVLIIGAGPAGLTAAATLAPRVAGTVLVLDRESRAGGVPRHSDHLGYGIRDLHRFISGPQYARRLVAEAERYGARIRTETMVTGWATADPTSTPGSGYTVDATSPAGREQIHAKAVILATGARERPRSARLVPGDRAAGIYTTGQLQNLVHLHHQNPGKRAVIVGAELVSYSAAVTLREAGCEVVAMISSHARPESYKAFTIGGRVALKLNVITDARVTRISGSKRVQSVEVEERKRPTRRTLECDTVVFTGDWIPDHELARAGGIELDPNTRGPLVDPRQATNQPGIFAIGNLTHPVDTADVAAIDGVAVVPHVLSYLNRVDTSTAHGARVLSGRGLQWISPGLYRPGATPPRGKLLAWPQISTPLARITVTQGGHVIAAKRLVWPASAGRVLRIPVELLKDTNPDGGPITVQLG